MSATRTTAQHHGYSPGIGQMIIGFLRNRFILALTVFVITDLLLFYIFGCRLLDGMEFTGLKTAIYNAIANASSTNELASLEKLLASMPTVTFRAGEYFRYCTLLCLGEDALITVIYFLCSDKENLKRTESVFFCLAHASIKILLNLHAAGMFLSTLEYSREFNWTAVNFSAKPEDIRDLELTGYFLPEYYWSEMFWSLCLALSVICLTFAILLLHRKWPAHPYLTAYGFVFTISLFVLFSTNDQAVKLKPLVFVLPAVLIWLIWQAQKKFQLLTAIGSLFTSFRTWIWRKFYKQTEDDKIDLYRIWTWSGTVLFLFVTVLWCVVVPLVKSNPNSVLGFHYSAILKLLTPMILIVNLLLSRIESRHPEKYKQHSLNDYHLQSLMFILTGCAALAFLGEFGSIVCILALTIVMFFLNENTFEKPNGAMKKAAVSLLAGTLIALTCIAAENGVFQLIARFCGFRLEGSFAGLSLDSVIVMVLGLVCMLVLAAAFLYGVSALFFPEEVLRKNVKFWFANRSHRFSGKITRRMGDRSERTESRVYISLILIPVVSLVLGYNFFFNWYSGTTVLRSYYLTAGNFSTEFEITENITIFRIEEVNCIQDDPETTLSEEIRAQLNLLSAQVWPEKTIVDYQRDEGIVKELSDLDYYYKAYDKPFSKVMSIIERLCFSSHTAELSSVQNGLKQNMGFRTDEIKTTRTYIPTLQSNREYVTRSDVMNASPAVQSMYFRDDGTLMDNLYLLDENGKEAGGYIWYETQVEDESHIVVYEDGTKAYFDVPVLQKERIFKSAKPQTANSDYMLYTLSRMGVGNVLLLIFLPYFTILVLLLITNVKIQLHDDFFSSGVRFVLHHLGLLYAVSFVIQTIVILLGVFGISLFSGLSIPLVAAGDCEMLLNSMSAAALLFALGDSSKAAAAHKAQE